ncbi:PorV/PorQ family protein [Melioribacter sp. Ez-97]|uniref:PorV/PorQ family protein n=1 Tax=Melioribacter sp. Ez-97 TaxID=3423434 RepID=UPI003EDB36F7
MKKKIILFVLILSSLNTLSFAEGVNKIGTAAAAFLRIPVGARATGFGSAFVSMAGDPSALYWNPSVISTLDKNSLMIDHSPWLPGINFDFAGIVLPLGNFGTLGISTTILQTDEMDVTTPAAPMGTGETFTASSFAVGITYSRYLTDRFSIGGTFKYIRETIYNSSAAGIAFDIGTIYETPFAGIRLAAVISNFGTKMRMFGEDLNVRVDIAPDQEGNNQSIVGKLNTDEFDLPLIMRIGLSGEVFDTEDFRLTLAADGVNPNDNAQSVNLGAEAAFLNEKLQIRAGYRDLFLDNNEFGLSFGISIANINLWDSVLITTDYAYQTMKHLGNTNRFSVIIKF